MTDFQPVLPAEVPFSDAELAFMDESPPGLFPENQNSNFGYIIRKISSDRVQELINQLDTIYGEKFVATSVQYLDEWERVTGLPVNPTSYTQPQRRTAILNRLRKGAFTRAARQAIVESFITATFGPSPAFDPSGIPLDGSGIPLYSGINSLAGTYTIRENYTWRNLITADPSFEAGVSGYSYDGTLSALTSSTAQAKFGTHAARGVAANATPYIYVTTGIPVTVGLPYTASAHILAPRNVNGQVALQFLNASSGVISTPSAATALTAGQWKRISATAVAPAGAVSCRPIFYGATAGAVVGDVFYWDAVQLEQDSVMNDWSDPAGSNFYYEVRLLNTLGVDITGLTRELNRITPAGISFAITQTPSP